jgi:uncharacterized repeat protein (TIGR01451 family)
MNRKKSLSLILGVAANLIVPVLAVAAEPATIERLSYVGLEIGAAAKPDAANQARLDHAYGKLPLQFEANRGQTDASVGFLSRGRGYTLFLTSTEAVMVLTRREARGKRDRFSLTQPGLAQPEKTTQTVVRMKLVGANPKPKLAGLEELPGKVNYFIGNDPKKWRTNVPTCARVEYKNVYPGVNLVYYGNQRQLEYDLVVAPGADPKAIRLAFEGVHKFALDAQGNLILHTAGGELLQRAPIVYQEIDGARQKISGRYVLKTKDRVGFQVAAYDRTKPLVIDPVLVYSTYLSGTGYDEGFGIAVDTAGNAYVTGFTESTDFPTTAGAFQTTSGGGRDAFVTKLNSGGSGPVYSAYLGGSGLDEGLGIAVDTAGNAYVTGLTQSTDFPTTAGAFQTFGGTFVTKVNPTGSTLVYSTRFGDGSSNANGIAVDAVGNAYVTGQTGASHAFVAKFDPTGSALVYSTYLSGGNTEAGFGIAVDVAGNAYVTGYTASSNFPTTVGAVQPTFGGGFRNAFVTKLNPTGSGFVYSTYLGGSNDDVGFGVAVDTAGNAYVTGDAGSTDFPTTAGAFQPTYGGSEDAFVTKLNPAGSALVYSTYLGGSSQDLGLSIAVDTSGNAYVTGFASSAEFPTTLGAIQTTNNSGFVAKFDSTGSALVYSTHFGGFNRGIALDTSTNPNAYVTGFTPTPSTDLPTTPGAFQTTPGGGGDAFVGKIAAFNTPAGSKVNVSAGNGVNVTFTAVVSPGNTGATTSTSGPTPPAGFTLGTPPTYYNIQTTATFVPPVSVCITYDPAQFGDPSMLHLFHFENNAWVDATTSNDTSNHVICGSVNSLSPFAIFQKLAPADMAIRKGGPSTIKSGSNLTYSIGVVNLGPNTASGVVVTDHVPAGTSFVSAQFAKGSCTVSGGTVVSCTVSQQGTPCAFSNGTVTCNIGTLSPYTPANPSGAGIQLVVHVTAPRGVTITNTATVSASNPDPNQANNSSTATTSVK